MDWSLKGKPDAEKAKTLVCAIIARAGGKFNGKTRLNKAFWWAHVYHYRNNDGLLSQYPIARLPEGPAIDDADDLLVALEREGRISLSEQPKGRHLEDVFTLKSEPPILSIDEQQAINAAVAWVGKKSAIAISRESHELSRSWKNAKNGEILDPALDAISKKELPLVIKEEKQILSHLQKSTQLVGDLFGARRVGSTGKVL